MSADERDCGCPPCPGRGNDGHGMTHCAEYCFGTGVEADLDCPTHGMSADERVALTEGERDLLDDVWQEASFAADLFPTVTRIKADAHAAGAAAERARALGLLEDETTREAVACAVSAPQLPSPGATRYASHALAALRDRIGGTA